MHTTQSKTHKTKHQMENQRRDLDDHVTGTLSTIYLSEASSTRFYESFIERFVEVLVRFMVVFVTPLHVCNTSVFMLPHDVQHTA